VVNKSVFLAERENHVRQALRLMLEHQNNISVAGEASHAESLLAQVCQQPPDAILLDWFLPGLHPQRMITAIRLHCPNTLILVMSIKPEQKSIVMRFGVDGFLSKQMPPEKFIQSLRNILKNALDV
jgi:DNA-binding NarL/FixJ family response regulator